MDRMTQYFEKIGLFRETLRQKNTFIEFLSNLFDRLLGVSIIFKKQCSLFENHTERIIILIYLASNILNSCTSI